MADYDFLPAGNGSGDAALAHITDIRTAPAATIKVDTVTNFPTKFIGTWGTLGSDGYIVPSSARNFKGHVSGADIIIDAMEPGSTDGGNTVGQVVIIKPTTGWANRVAAFIKNATNFGTPEAVTFAGITGSSATISGNQTVGGTLAVSGVFTPSGGFAAGSIPTAAIADGAIDGTKLATSAIKLGYAQITSNFVSSQASPTYAQVTGLTATVTIPSGGRGVKITVFCHALGNTTSNVEMGFALWDGAVNSGTQLQQSNTYLANNTLNQHATMIWYGTPSAGSKTYNVGFNMNGGTSTISASSVNPAFILVELI